MSSSDELWLLQPSSPPPVPCGVNILDSESLWGTENGIVNAERDLGRSLVKKFGDVGLFVEGRSLTSFISTRWSSKSDVHLRRKEGERRGSLSLRFSLPCGVDGPDSGVTAAVGRPRLKYQAVPLSAKALSVSVSTGSGVSASLKIAVRSASVIGSGLFPSVISLAIVLEVSLTGRIVCRTACRPSCICASIRYRFSIICSFTNLKQKSVLVPKFYKKT